MSDRDKRQVKTPPPGVLGQIAKPEMDFEEVTPPMGMVEDLAVVRSRTKDTLQRVGETYDRVDAVRIEMTERIDKVDNKVDALAVNVATISGQISVIHDGIVEDREDRKVQRQLVVTERTAVIEVGKARSLSEIEADKASALDDIAVRRWRRNVALKIIVGVLALWTAISVPLLSQC